MRKRARGLFGGSVVVVADVDVQGLGGGGAVSFEVGNGGLRLQAGLSVADLHATRVSKLGRGRVVGRIYKLSQAQGG